MTNYQCGSCSFGSNDLGALQQHTHQTDHVGIHEKDGIETPEVAEAVEEAEPTGGRSGKGRIAAAVALGLLAAAAGVLTWENKRLTAENDELAAENGELKSMAGGLLSELAELVAENEYLKSASGAGTTLNSHRGR
ncbi:hypothetical protein ACFQ7N_40125 [Streptomyces niveus]|uniref:hypothetical protein n=1 Tax=Streptomyces niveus TaxID=193462 RepID=UPI00368A146E